MLIVFGGLPGTGKTTLSRALAAHRTALYLRIDAIEQAMRQSGVPHDTIGASGYAVANALADCNLALGLTVVVDAVNPVAESREAWRAIAARAGVRIVEIEVVCSDAREHRRRVEGRLCDIPGLVPPTWDAVTRRLYAPWPEPHLVVDTARHDAGTALAVIEASIDG